MTIETPELVRASIRSAVAAIGLWSEGNRDEALTKLLSAFEENSVCGPDWCWLAASWQTLVGRADAEALAVLRRFSSCVPEWYFANALLLFRQFGDSDVSRAAIRVALDDGSPIGLVLIDKFTSDDYDEGLTLEGSNSYPENALQIWKETPGAIEWLDQGFSRWSKSSGQSPAEMDESNKGRQKRWLDNFEFGLTQSRRGDQKQAKKSFLSALREARHFGPLSWEFETTVLMIITEDLGANEQVQAALKEQLESVKALDETERITAMRAYTRIGHRLMALHAPTNANDAFEAALKILRSLNDTEKFEVDFYEQADLLETAAGFYTNDDERRRSVSMYEEAIDLQAKFLGDNHPQLIETMLGLRRCLICLSGKREAVAALDARLVSLDPDALADEEKDFSD